MAEGLSDRNWSVESEEYYRQQDILEGLRGEAWNEIVGLGILNGIIPGHTLREMGVSVFDKKMYPTYGSRESNGRSIRQLQLTLETLNDDGTHVYRHIAIGDMGDDNLLFPYPLFQNIPSHVNGALDVLAQRAVIIDNARTDRGLGLLDANLNLNNPNTNMRSSSD
jgi:hypothetical protein